MTIIQIFKTCANAIADGKLITRAGAMDKEFHFQNWFQDRLSETDINFDSPGRNSYPDFRLVNDPIGFEIKGLAYPGRTADYDSNSQVPTPVHNGREIFYVFGRYPKVPDGNQYPVLDLVICHGSFLNADSQYIHKNKSARGFGSYGDIMIRDRKMYVVPTPYNLADGLAHNITLVLPRVQIVDDSEMIQVGSITREETKELLIKYSFDLQTNELFVDKVTNPNAGNKHEFTAYRLKGASTTPVQIKSTEEIIHEIEQSEEED
jgi:hypothetical protein